MVTSVPLKAVRLIRMLALCVLIASPLAAQDPFLGKPIPNGPDARTNGTYREGLYRYYLQLVDHYKRHTKDPESVQQAGVKLLTAAVRTRCLEAGDKGFDELLQVSNETFEAGTKDPLVLQRYARLRAIDKDYETARTILLDCEAQLTEAGYPTIVRMLNSFYLCALARATFDDELMQTHFPTFLDRFTEWVHAELKVPENRRYVFDLAISMTADFDTVERKQAIVEALTRPGPLDAWFIDTFAGALEIDIAWLYRGNSWGSDVTAGGWQSFAQHLQVASGRLHRAWKAQPDYPEAASYMITVAMGGNEIESPRTWFDRAVAAEMDHPWAYQRLSNAMLPRWGGSHQTMSRFGLECLATKRFDTAVPLQLFYQVRSVEYETGGTDRYWRSPKVYARLREMFEGYRNAPEVPELQALLAPRKKVLTAYAAVALVAERWEDAIAALDAAGGELDQSLMKDMQVGPFYVSRAYAAIGDPNELVHEAEQLAKLNTEESLAQAIVKLTAAAEQNSDERAAAYFTGQARIWRELVDFHQGEWAELTFDDSLSGWRVNAGDWTRESDQAIIGEQDAMVDPGYYVPLALRSQHQFQPPYQLTVDIEELAGSTLTGVGVTIGEVSFDGSRESTGRFCYTHGGAAGIDRGVHDPSTTNMNTPTGMGFDKPKYHMDIRVWPRSMLQLVNHGGPLGTVVDASFDPGVQIGFAGRYQASFGRLRYSNVRIRKLPYAPLPQVRTHEQLVAEGAKMVEFDADDWFARWVRGSSNYELKKYEDAVVDFRELERIQPNHQGALYMAGASYAKTNNYAEAIEKFKAAIQLNPEDFRVLRLWAELELTATDLKYRNPQSALAHAREAYLMANRLPDAWRYQLTMADAYAELGDYTKAIKTVASIGTMMDPNAVQEITAKTEELRSRKGKSYKSAIASLLWEGDMTMRILGVVLAVVLLAANLIVIGKLARFGWWQGATAGAFGLAISIGIPCAVAILFGMGEGPAFIKLMAGIVGVAAIGGAIGGACSSAKHRQSNAGASADDGDGPMQAEVLAD